MPEPNPLTDPMWSNAHLRLVHDGAEATRMPKVEAIGGSDVALRNLRVCYFNREGRYKCGQCEKCLRARVALRLCGAEERATSFEGGLDLGKVARLLLHPRGPAALVTDAGSGRRAG